MDVIILGSLALSGFRMTCWLILADFPRPKTIKQLRRFNESMGDISDLCQLMHRWLYHMKDMLKNASVLLVWWSYLGLRHSKNKPFFDSGLPQSRFLHIYRRGITMFRVVLFKSRPRKASTQSLFSFSLVDCQWDWSIVSLLYLQQQNTVSTSKSN